MAKKEWAALAALTFGVLGMALALESRVTGTNAFLERPTPQDPPPGVEPFRRTLSLAFEAGARQARSSFEVPRGKRLILELATASVAASPTDRVSARLTTQGSGEDVLDHRLGLASSERAGRLEAVQPLRAFADAGTTVTIALDRPGPGGTSTASATLFGYLLDVP